MSKRDAMIRVDQAGEYGATRIYAGQLAVMGDRAPHSGEIRAMAEQEAGHQAEFDALTNIMNAPLVRCDVAQWTLAGISLAGFNALISVFSAVAIFVLLAKARRG